MATTVIKSLPALSTYNEAVRTFPHTTDGDTAARAWVQLNDGHEIVEVAKDDYADLAIRIGWYVNTADNSVHEVLPNPDAVAADLRGEIVLLLREQLGKFPDKLFKIDGTEGSQRTELVFRRARNILAYAAIDGNLTDESKFSILKAEAEADWLEVANYAAAAWLTAYADSATAFYEWSKPSVGTAFGGVALPTATATLTAPANSQAITDVKLAQELR